MTEEIVSVLDEELGERSSQARRIACAIADIFDASGVKATSRIFQAVGDHFDYSDAEMGYGL